MEHVFEAFILLANEVAKAFTAFTKIQQCVGRATLTHLVIEARQRDMIRRAQGAVGLHTNFGNQK